MSSGALVPCPYCKRTPNVCELPEKRGWYQVVCLNEECRGKLISEVYRSEAKAIRAWAQFLSERTHIHRRLHDLSEMHYVLCSGTIVWNDITRYPDLPADSTEKPLYPPYKRNTTNEFHIRYLSSAHEAYIVLALWHLLFDDSQGTKGHLRKLAERLLKCGVRSKDFPSDALKDCLAFLGEEQSAKAFERYRNMRLAHLGTYEATKDIHLNSDLIYQFVPKASYLFEILNEELERLPEYTENQWSSTGLITAHFFSHSRKDELLFKLFQSRVLPSKEYLEEFTNFISRRRQREQEAH